MLTHVNPAARPLKHLNKGYSKHKKINYKKKHSAKLNWRLHAWRWGSKSYEKLSELRKQNVNLWPLFACNCTFLRLVVLFGDNEG
jgi:hypothetical protein